MRFKFAGPNDLKTRLRTIQWRPTHGTQSVNAELIEEPRAILVTTNQVLVLSIVEAWEENMETHEQPEY